jgi:hypothetical protein
MTAPLCKIVFADLQPRPGLPLLQRPLCRTHLLLLVELSAVMRGPLIEKGASYIYLQVTLLESASEKNGYEMKIVPL